MKKTIGFAEFEAKWQANARLALDTFAMRTTHGIPSTWLNDMQWSHLETLSGNPPGSYENEPVRVYLEFQLKAGACFIDQWIPDNPLSMKDRGYESARTGAEEIVRDGMLIDSPEAAVAHMEKVLFPQWEQWRRNLEANADEDVRKRIAAEVDVQNLFGMNMLKVPYGGFFTFPGFLYGHYGYANYFMAYALYPEVIERGFKINADAAEVYNRIAARAIIEGGLPRLIRLDHDMADSKGTLVDIKSLDKIWFPHFARSIKPLLDAGIKLIWHCDGNLSQMVPRLLEAGLHGFQGFQYEDGMDYEKICRMKTKNGDSLIIWAGVSVTRTLPFGKPEDVRKEMKWLVEQGPQTGLFLGVSSSIAPGVPWENMKTLVEGLNYYRQHGREGSATFPSPAKKQLQMIYPAELSSKAPDPKLPAGYRLRQYCPEDEKAYLHLMAKAGFKDWKHETLEVWLNKILPAGFFVIVHAATRKIVATAMATHNPRPEMPFGGELGWVAGDPEHAGHGLGQAVCAAVVRRFIEAGYRTIYLLTDDFRLPAIKAYLKIGFKPFISSLDMEARWHKIYSALKWPYEP